MKANEPVVLRRDCEAIQIPSGYKLMLPAGSEVMITQSLGGSFTVVTDHGNMLRIASNDADALGLEPMVAPAAEGQVPTRREDVEPLVWEQLRTCYDPEIPVNIVDLGLVYDCLVTPLPGGGHKVDIKFTLTAPGCGMAGSLKMDTEGKILAVPGVQECEVEVVFDPPWNRSMISEAAKLDLGML